MLQASPSWDPDQADPGYTRTMGVPGKVGRRASTGSLPSSHGGAALRVPQSPAWQPPAPSWSPTGSRVVADLGLGCRPALCKAAQVNPRRPSHCSGNLPGDISFLSFGHVPAKLGVAGGGCPGCRMRPKTPLEAPSSLRWSRSA